MAPLHDVFGFTSSSFVRGAADDAALKSHLEIHSIQEPFAGVAFSAELATDEIGTGNQESEGATLRRVLQ